MPNVKGGKNYKRANNKSHTKSKEKVPWADQTDLLYGQIEKNMGGNTISVMCADNVTRRITIPGSFRKKVWMHSGDIILVQIDPLNQMKGYVLYKYSPEDAQSLKSRGDITFKIEKKSNDDNEITFGEEMNELHDDNSEDVDLETIQKTIEQTKQDRRLKTKVHDQQLAQSRKTKADEDREIKISTDSSDSE